MNIDKSEIAKFEQLAHKWWDKESEFKPLHEINPLRVNWINERVDLKGKKILDIGCGGGILTETLYQRGAQVVGIDMAEASLSVAKIHQLESRSKIKYQQITAEELAQSEQNEYDIITCLEMLITYKSQEHHEMGPQKSYKQFKTTILQHFSHLEAWYHSFLQIMQSYHQNNKKLLFSKIKSNSKIRAQKKN